MKKHKDPSIAIVMPASQDMKLFACASLWRLSKKKSLRKIEFYLLSPAAHESQKAKFNSHSLLFSQIEFEVPGIFYRLPVSEIWTQVSWYRLFIVEQSTLAQYDYVILLGTDTFTEFTYQELLLRLPKKALSAYRTKKVKYPHPLLGHVKKYIHADVLIYNTKAWRTQRIEERIKSFIELNHRELRNLPRLDQDVLNATILDDCDDLPVNWCWEPGDHVFAEVPKKRFKSHLSITHWAGIGKPWRSAFYPPITKTLKWRFNLFLFKAMYPDPLRNSLRLLDKNSIFAFYYYYLPQVILRTVHHIQRRR